MTKQKDIYQLIKEANKKKPSSSDIQALRNELATKPELFDDFASLSYQAIHSAIKSVKSSKGFEELLIANWTDLSTQLGEKEANPFEKLLIQNVITCWIRLTVVEIQYSEAMSTSSSINLKKYWDGRLNASQQRFLRAMETYARIKKHAASGIFQINIASDGGKQINLTESKSD